MTDTDALTERITGADITENRTLTPITNPEPAWVGADYVWADYDGDRGIFTRVQNYAGETFWVNAATDEHFTREDMAGRNPVPVKGEAGVV